jgi:hypothetical protein
MLASQRSLASVQLNRSTTAVIAKSPTPWREAALEAFRRRNAVLDALFYDVGKVTDEEARRISPWLAKEGAILIVPPTGEGPLELCQTIEEFADKDGHSIRALAVAGVGSSALGSAAFARNVADAFHRPVAAVVSGYGLADVVTEAAGGWFWFGTLNRFRHELEPLDDLSRRWQTSRVLDGIDLSGMPLRTLSLDTKAVYALLSNDRFKFSLLTGHSKGNLVISEALFELDRGATPGRHQPSPDTWLVTVSAVIAMPSRYKRIVDVIGDIDWFGALNSRLDMDVEKRPHMAWHHTNTELCFHLPVTKVFDELIESRGIKL